MDSRRETGEPSMTGPRNLVLPAGVVAVVMGLSLVHARIAEPAYSFGGSRLVWALAYSGLVFIAAYAFGLPDVPSRARQIFAAAVGAATVGAIGISVAQLLGGAALLPRFVVLGAVPSLMGWMSLCSFAVRRHRRRAVTRDRVVIVGSGEDTAAASRVLDSNSERPAEVIGVFDPAVVTRRQEQPAPLIERCRDLGATVVVLDRSAQGDQSIVDQVALLHEGGVRVRTLSLFYEQWLGRLPVGELERISLMFDIGEIHRARFARRKRLLDIAAALVAMPLLVLVTPLVAVGNLVGNRGSVLFHQTRVGKGGSRFRIVKFRTMRPGDAQDGEACEWTSANDPRITRFGRILRRTHLDELPQVVNVLRGELSMVGPRPEQPHYVEELAAKLPFYELRHLVQPGLTGWAQVNQGYAASSDDALEKLQYEFWYLRHQRFAVDVRILARTVRSVVGGHGR